MLFPPPIIHTESTVNDISIRTAPLGQSKFLHQHLMIIHEKGDVIGWIEGSFFFDPKTK